MTKTMIEATILAAALFCSFAPVAKHPSAKPNSTSPSVAIDDRQSGVEKLRKADVAATLAGDPEGLANLLADDGVLLEPGSKPLVGREAILAEKQKEKALNPEAKVLTYEPHFQDTQIMDGWAVEWGYFDASYRQTTTSEIKRLQGRMLRVLRRQPNGEWKFARVMWNLA